MEETMNKIVLPAMAVRGCWPLPSNELKIEVGRAPSVEALNAAEKMYGGNVILLIQKNVTKQDITKDDVETIGVLARVTLKLKLPNSNFRVKFMISNRVKITEFTQEKPYFVVSYDKLFSIMDNDEKEVALVKNVIKEVQANFDKLVIDPDMLRKKLSNDLNADVLSDVVANHLKLTHPESKLNYINELSASKRLEMILDDIETEKQIIELEKKIDQEVRKNIDESQKEYYLREKMKVIQNELGDRANQEEDIAELRKRIEEAHLPEKVLKKAKEQLKKYENTNSQMAESEVIRNYLDWIVNLPW